METSSNSRDLQISGSCSEGIDIHWSGHIEPSSVTHCIGNLFSTQVRLTNGDSSKVLTATQTDLSGKSISVTIHLAMDTVSPILSFNALPNRAYMNNAHVEFSGSCESGINVGFSGDIVGTPTASCVNGVFRNLVNISGADGL